MNAQSNLNASVPDGRSDEQRVTAYDPPQILATYDAGEILGEAETGSVIIIVS